MYLPYNLFLWQNDQETWLVFEWTYIFIVFISFSFLWIAVVFVADGWHDPQSFLSKLIHYQYVKLQIDFYSPLDNFHKSLENSWSDH